MVPSSGWSSTCRSVLVARAKAPLGLAGDPPTGPQPTELDGLPLRLDLLAPVLAPADLPQHHRLEALPGRRERTQPVGDPCALQSEPSLRFATHPGDQGLVPRVVRAEQAVEVSPGDGGLHLRQELLDGGTVRHGGAGRSNGCGKEYGDQQEPSPACNLPHAASHCWARPAHRAPRRRRRSGPDAPWGPRAAWRGAHPHPGREQERAGGGGTLQRLLGPGDHPGGHPEPIRRKDSTRSAAMFPAIAASRSQSWTVSFAERRRAPDSVPARLASGTIGRKWTWGSLCGQRRRMSL